MSSTATKQALRAAAAGFLLPISGLACTVCHSETAVEVRAGIFNGDFWWNLFALLTPFAVFAAVVIRMHYGRLPWFYQSVSAEEDNAALCDAHGAYGGGAEEGYRAV